MPLYRAEGSSTLCPLCPLWLKKSKVKSQVPPTCSESTDPGKRRPKISCRYATKCIHKCFTFALRTERGPYVKIWGRNGIDRRVFGLVSMPEHDSYLR